MLALSLSLSLSFSCLVFSILVLLVCWVFLSSVIQTTMALFVFVSFSDLIKAFYSETVWVFFKEHWMN